MYEKPEKEDGFRILVDRLWPRGLTREKADVDLWLKDIAPSTELRKWFGHNVAKWEEFQEHYLTELHDKSEQITIIKDKLTKGAVTLVYGARDQLHNEALVLVNLIKE